jgi:hypothetical protein
MEKNKTCSKPPARYGLARQMNQTIIPSISIEHHPAVQGTVPICLTHTQTTKSVNICEAPNRAPPLASFVFILSTLWRLSLLWDEGENQKIYMKLWEFERDRWFVNVNGLNFSPRMQQSSFETRVLFDKLNLE